MRSLLTLFILVTSLFSVAQNVVLDSIPYKDGHRIVRLFLPDNYEARELPLLVMMDGQNLFEEKTSYAGEWKIDETISSLPLNQQAIVFAIDHGNNLRMEELTAYKNDKYGGGNAAGFLEWMMEKVLPQTIDRYKLRVDTNKRAIAGSSLGGLFAHYAALQHPEYFQTAGVFSPSFWWSDEVYNLVENHSSLNHQHFFFTAGTEEGDEMLPDMRKMHNLMLKKNAVMYYLEMQNAQHNEAQWSATFPAFYRTWINLK
ncbi:MAG: alpha/beta hydrolase [Nonlabens sp.]|uniref:alpha/beta hydrolase n=1 Tax=Nonlabens sp. TaxID=1888209 RepID=UPI003EF60F6A